MRLSQNFIPTLKENPSEAQIPSHLFMLRAGLVRQLASGVFSFLPLGFRVLNKVMNILREEMNAIGGQEFLLPALSPIDIWEETGRVEAIGEVMFHLKNRDGLILAPTHEEVITFHARQHISSYKELPQIWYQIQTKFRNEARPKSGVLRGRQFIMKDAYSLDKSWEDLDVSYDKHYKAYQRIFDRCGIRYFVVGASSGSMGGRQSQEFMVESQSGEDTCAINEKSGFAANVEVATSRIMPVTRIDENKEIEKFATPNARTINELSEQFNLPKERCAKSVVYIVDDKPTLILMRGNDELNETKLEAALGTSTLRPAESEELVKFTGANTGSIGPIGLKTKMTIIADNLLKGANGLVSGANIDGFHIRNIDMDRDCRIDAFYDLRTVQEGEPDPNGGEPLRIVNAIELGHIFKLGTKYSEALGANILDENGKEKPIIMGSYGIGVERIIACYIEQNHDENGIIWNKELTPYHIHLLSLNPKKSEDVKNTANKLYNSLIEQGFEVLYDDTDDMAGVKFNNADLIGIPVQVLVGMKNLKDGNIELKYRSDGTRSIVPLQEISGILNEYYKIN